MPPNLAALALVVTPDFEPSGGFEGVLLGVEKGEYDRCDCVFTSWGGTC